MALLLPALVLPVCLSLAVQLCPTVKDFLFIVWCLFAHSFWVFVFIYSFWVFVDLDREGTRLASVRTLCWDGSKEVRWLWGSFCNDRGPVPFNDQGEFIRAKMLLGCVSLADLGSPLTGNWWSNLGKEGLWEDFYCLRISLDFSPHPWMRREKNKEDIPSVCLLVMSPGQKDLKVNANPLTRKQK